jgi:hypothetical protein
MSENTDPKTKIGQEGQPANPATEKEQGVKKEEVKAEEETILTDEETKERVSKTTPEVKIPVAETAKD